ncbi:MAG: porin family protein [Rhodomicrobium sp.]|nr:porin family protein [Rhodomicrobium sp.]
MKIKAGIFAAVALAITSLAARVQAGDLRDVPYVGVSNWSGYYVGGSLGFERASIDMSTSIAGIPISGSGSDTQLTLGFLAGYNWQQGNRVWGIEGDINPLSGFDYLASIRGRYGVIHNNWLYYGTAGIGFVDSGGSVSVAGYRYDSYSGAGLVIGAGAETKINSRLSAGVEGLFYIFAEDSQNLMGLTVNTDVDVFTIRGRLTYQLDTPSDLLK